MATEKARVPVAQSFDFIPYGHAASIMNAAVTKEQLLATGQQEKANETNIIVFIEGGGQAVAAKVGLLMQMHKRHLFNGAVTAVIGASAGSVLGAYGVAGDTKAVGIFTANCDNRLASARNIFDPQVRALVNFTQYEQVLRERYPLNTQKLRESGTQAVALLFNTDKRRLEAVSLNDHPDPTSILLASCNIPYVGDKKTVQIGDDRYVDGSLTGIPIEMLIEMFRPTDILILRTGPHISSRRQQQVENFLEKISHLPMSATGQDTLAALYHGRETVRHLMRHNRHPDRRVRVGVLAPDQLSIGTLTMERELIQSAITASYDAAERFFRRHVRG